LERPYHRRIQQPAICCGDACAEHGELSRCWLVRRGIGDFALLHRHVAASDAAECAAPARLGRFRSLSSAQSVSSWVKRASASCSGDWVSGAATARFRASGAVFSAGARLSIRYCAASCSATSRRRWRAGGRLQRRRRQAPWRRSGCSSGEVRGDHPRGQHRLGEVGGTLCLERRAGDHHSVTGCFGRQGAGEVFDQQGEQGSIAQAVILATLRRVLRLPKYVQK
jgi:hypothetical protein